MEDRKGAEGGYRDVSCFIKVPTLGEPYPSGPTEVDAGRERGNDARRSQCIKRGARRRRGDGGTAIPPAPCGGAAKAGDASPRSSGAAPRNSSSHVLVADARRCTIMPP